MKLLSATILGLCLATSGFLSATPTKRTCGCDKCECTPESHCGCYSDKGCNCNSTTGEGHCVCNQSSCKES